MRIKNLRQLKHEVKKVGLDVPSNRFLLICQPEDIRDSLEWFQSQFPNKDIIPLYAMIFKEGADPDPDPEDGPKDTELKQMFFDIETGERVRRPDWFNLKFMAYAFQFSQDKKDDDNKQSKIVIPSNIIKDGG